MKAVITIARSYGSGGKEIGKALAKALGIKYYGREIFEISQGDESELYSGDDESIHKSSSFEEADELFKRQSATIKEIAERENCVIVGRCADYVLRDTDNVVKVYLYAPLRDCMRRVIRLYELNPEDAKSLIRSMNKTRGDYYFHNTGKVWSDPVHYDLCLNTAGLDTKRCIEIIKNYIDVRFKNFE
ncbi:MAG: cytidylate kinase-like family protein [Oscillospiraceae bacterium]|nr:cytidylate kinase-like family protein [Oscillospiraceae bacterium]